MTYSIPMTPEEYQNAIAFLYQGNKTVQVMVTVENEQVANVINGVVANYRAKRGQPNYKR